MAVVRKVTLRNRLSGMLGLLPATIITAMASPMARPMPSTVDKYASGFYLAFEFLQ